jgi:hypothetical protein
MGRRILAGAVITITMLAAWGAVADAKGGPQVRRVQLLDRCDPETFNAAVGPGACTRNGGVTFDHFIAQLVKLGRAPAWRFSPPRGKLASGGTVLAKNRGGEDHTFSEVAAYGGGCVQVLNDILGLTPVDECPEGLSPSALIHPGDTRAVTGLASGVHRFQCLIHPWQHSTIRVR